MSGVRFETVDDADDGLRVDRWLRNHFPNLKQGKLQKLLRTGQVRLDGRRVKANDRVEGGQEFRIPPTLNEEDAKPLQKRSRHLDVEAAERLATEIKQNILHRDDDLIVVNKPPGLAVQGGSKTDIHLDGVLDWLKFGADERPRLVHRLDKDTSGVLLLARSRVTANALTKAFQARETLKVYWALVDGVPEYDTGVIDAPLAKLAGSRGELVEVNEQMGQSAVTEFRVIDRAGKSATWLELMPKTGRTHQLRAHCKVLQTPIFGDPKYGMRGSPLAELGIAERLHLHARQITLNLPRQKVRTFIAPMPDFMRETWQALGFDPNDENAEVISE